MWRPACPISQVLQRERLHEQSRPTELAFERVLKGMAVSGGAIHGEYEKTVQRSGALPVERGCRAETKIRSEIGLSAPFGLCIARMLDPRAGSCW